MVGLLIASSPVEIEAKAQAGALPGEALTAALSLFHRLTDRVGHASRALDDAHSRWPTHRFYFAEGSDSEMAALLEGLRNRPDYLEVTHGAPVIMEAPPSGLFALDVEQGFTGLLVGHESHEGAQANDPGV